MSKEKLLSIVRNGMKVFGITAGLLTCMSCVDASISSNLPKSTITNTFPSTYQTHIDKLKKIYPNASFKAVNTNLDWSTVVKHESYEVNKRISTIHDSYGDEWKRNGTNTGNYIDGPYVTASKSGVAYVLDPRNSLYEEYIFQFEGLTHSDTLDTKVIDKVLANTLLVGTYANQYKNAGKWIKMDMTYSEIICKVAKELNVSSVYIASRMKQETSGRIDTNGSINGSSTVYPGVYNFFNIGATPGSDGISSVMNGLKTAKDKGWTTPYLSIYGGVNIIKNNYIKWGQDTVYFQKFDVNNPYGNAVALMAYQYQTNILAPRSESINSYNAYKKMDMLDSAFVFYIPVYKNMPEDASPYPAGDSAKFETDNTKVYLDDTSDKNVNDVFIIRSSASNQLDNVIYTVTETKEGANNRTLMTRTKKGVGYDWDYVEFTVGGKTIKGYVCSDYVKEYDYVKVSSVGLDSSNITLEVNESVTLVANVLPTNAKYKTVAWESSNTGVVTVENGKLTAKTIGTANITVTTIDQEKTATCTVTVTPKLPKITLDKEEYTIVVNGSITPKVTLKNLTKYIAEIKDTTIANITNGVVKGLKAGETILKLTGTDGNVTKEVKIIVTLKAPEKYVIDKTLSISNNVVTKINPGTTVASVLGKISLTNLTAEIKNISGTVITNTAKVGTGTVIRLLKEDKTEFAKLTVVIRGDTTGDGVINSGDLLKTVKYLKGSVTMDKQAGDVTKDGVINSADLLKVVKYLKGTTTIDFS